MVNTEHQMSCLLIIAGDWAQHSSRSLWTCFLCHTAPENPISSLLSDFPVSWVLSLLLKWPFCLSISQLKQSSLLSAFPKNCVQHDLFPLECPCVLLPPCDLPGSVFLEWDSLVKVHEWVESHGNWNKKLPEIIVNASWQRSQDRPGRGDWTNLSSLWGFAVGQDWGTAAESWVRSVCFSSIQKHFWV